jgi:predicted methyltransferase
MHAIGRSNIEHLNLTADKGLLEQIALRTRGTFLMARDLDRLPDEILALSSLKPVATITIKRLGFHEFQWIFYLLAGLLAVEWVVRKRYSLN